MVIVKYIFLFFLFLGVSFLGNLISRKYKNRVDELKDFKEALNILQSKMKFTYEPLGEIFNEIGEIFHKKSKISSIFKNASLNMENDNFKNSWEKSINSGKEETSLKDEDINLIKGLGNTLGKTNIDGQLNEITLTMNFLDTQIEKAENDCRKNEKMYRSLGTIFGLAIVIILI